MDGRHSGPLAASLVAAAHSRCPDPKPPLLPDAVGDVTALHCAAFVCPLPTSSENLPPNCDRADARRLWQMTHSQTQVHGTGGFQADEAWPQELAMLAADG